MTEHKRVEVGPGAGLSLILTDKFKTNYISLSLLSPLSDATAAMDALLPMVLRRATAKNPDMAAMRKRLDGMYGAKLDYTIRKKGETHVAGVCVEAIGNEFALAGEDVLGDAAALLMEVYFDPKLVGGCFDGDIVEQEKQNLCDLIAARVSDKRMYAMQRCFEKMCEGEAFGVSEYGREEQVRAITAQALYARYEQLIKSGRIEIFFVGAADEARLTDSVRRELSRIRRSDIVGVSTQVVRAAEQPRSFEEVFPVNQCKLAMGYRTAITAADADYPALVMFSGVYGATPVSKLFMNVRERLSLCYYCSSRLEKHKGLMIVNSGIELKNRGVAQKEIEAQLDAMRAGDFTADEMDAALKAMTNSYRASLDRAAMMEDWYIGQLLSGSSQSLAQAADALGGVTREDIVRVARGVTLDLVYFLKGSEA